MSLSFISPLTTSLPPTPQKKLVFIDAAVDNFSSLLKGLEPNSEAIVLDSSQDGIMQISNFLANYQGAIDSIQILSHGNAGSLQLGSSHLNLENLDQYQAVLSNWFASSSNSTGTRPDLLLFGCDVAAGEMGQEFVEKLSKITGADVAASTDLTGSVAKGGNWILEKVTGAIEATSAFTQTVKDAYEHILATFTVTNSNDSGPGSLRQAIIDANANPGLDNIFFDPLVKLIQPNSPLENITDPVNIDGRPGQAGTLPGVEINGLNAGSNYNQNSGLQLWGPRTAPPAWLTPYAGADGSTIRGLSITGFWGNGLLLFQTDNNTIEYNHIGADVTGTVARGNSRSNDASVYHALLLRGAQNNNIRNNLVSGNYGSGIVLFGGNLGLNFGYTDRNGNFPGTGRNSTGNQIINNITGLDITGTRAMSNERIGIFVEGVSNTVQNNLVAGNGTDSSSSGTYARGLMLEASPSTSSNSIFSNTVGTNASRTIALPNIVNGIPYMTTGNGDIEDAAGAGVNNNTFQGNSYYGFLYGVSGGLPDNLGGNFQVTGITAINNPTLTPIAPQLTTIVSNQAINNGDLVSTLVGGSITSTPGQGIGITAVDNTNGTWQYSTDNGNSWSDLNAAINTPPFQPAYGGAWPDGTANGGVPPAKTFMLAADAKNRIRFVPNLGFSGTVTNGVTYMAWNQAVGGNGKWFNLTPGGKIQIGALRRGFSMDNTSGAMTTDNLRIEVLPGNQAPVLDPVFVQPLAPIDKDPVTNPGTLVTALIPGVTVTDPDPGALEGIAVTNVDNSNGDWQYSTDGGANWLAFGTPSATNARLLAANANTRVRFVPNAGYEGTPAITFRAWDQSIGIAGGTTDVSVNGGVTPFSTALGTAAIAVGNVVLPPPVLPKPPTTPETPSPPIDPGFIPLLRNPPAPPTPDPTVIGNPPTPDLPTFPNPPSAFPFFLFPFTFPFGLLPFNFRFPNLNLKIAETVIADGNGDGCPCAATINQQQPNPIVDTIWGTNGNDRRLISKSQENGKGANTVYGLQGDDTIFGSGGNDNLFGGGGIDRIYGGKGRDFIQGGAKNDLLYGGKGNDVIFGGTGKDFILGGKGNDFLSGGSGKDLIYGEEGNDVIAGGEGKDLIFGGSGNDTICGCSGDDSLSGGKGDDTLYGGTGNDILYGGQGKDILFGGKGSDILFGDQGNDFLSGGAENDALYGGKGNDLLLGGEGEDLLAGGDGNDILWGGTGNDLLIGGKGLDILIGGEGSDRFRLAANNGMDTITDFKVGEDFLELAKGLKISDLQIVQVIGATVIGLQPNTPFPSDKPLAILLGVNADTITPTSFLSA
jgi:Ca2+-binding RTX toxin-like protein